MLYQAFTAYHAVPFIGKQGNLELRFENEIELVFPNSRSSSYRAEINNAGYTTTANKIFRPSSFQTFQSFSASSACTFKFVRFDMLSLLNCCNRWRLRRFNTALISKVTSIEQSSIRAPRPSPLPFLQLTRTWVLNSVNLVSFLVNAFL